MKIGGFIQEAFNEVPGKIMAVLFTAGCNLKCKFCQNHFDDVKEITVNEIIDLLEQNFLIDGIVITGGEPTLQPDLEDLVKKLHGEIYVELNTNGTKPDVLEKIIKHVDLTVMDIKGHYTKYPWNESPSVTKRLIEKSLSILEREDVKAYYRMVIYKGMRKEFFYAAANWLKDKIKKKLVLIPYNAYVGVTRGNLEEPTKKDLDDAFKYLKSGGIKNVVLDDAYSNLQ